MLRLMLGETLEQKRFFDQAARRAAPTCSAAAPTALGTKGEVLPTRWID